MRFPEASSARQAHSARGGGGVAGSRPHPSSRAAPRLAVEISVLGLLLWAGVERMAAADKPEPGLAVTFSALGEPASGSDADVFPTLALFVAAGTSPTPFVPGGKFRAVWEGTIAADLRGTFFFQAELNGHLRLEINGGLVLERDGGGGASPLSRAVRLNKGANALRATYTSPERGDAFLRVLWTEAGPATAPLPSSILSHSPTPALERAAQLHWGRELFLEHRCAKCHLDQPGTAAVPELAMDAPSLIGIGARRNPAWLRQWILDPRSQRADTRMPQLLHRAGAREEAGWIAAYLSTLQSGGEVRLPEPRPSDSAQPPAPAPDSAGETPSLFETLHCEACHNAPSAKEADPKKMSLTQVSSKFAPGKLEEYLRQPEAHYRWTRMPNFRLSAGEAKQLSDLLLTGTAAQPSSAGEALPAGPAAMERGAKLVQSSGCLSCHAGGLENRFFARKLGDLVPTRLDRGCLAPRPEASQRAPVFGFVAVEQEALRAFLRADRASLGRHVPFEFAERQTAALRCSACHGQFEGFPPLEVVGGKLKPEWMASFIAGDIPYKPRAEKHPKGEPWLAARMPSFRSRAPWLASGLTAQHGLDPRSEGEPAVDLELARLGQKLVGKDGGFSCISCHAVGPAPALEVFESEGLNLAYARERLWPAYYRRWLRNPLAIDPQTKMPVYFDAGKSPLAEVLEGDAEKQIDAIWQYLRLGKQMPAPSTGPAP